MNTDKKTGRGTDKQLGYAKWKQRKLPPTVLAQYGHKRIFDQKCAICLYFLQKCNLRESNTIWWLRGNVTLSGAETLTKIILPAFWKGIYFKRKEFASQGSKLFPFRVDPFTEGTWSADTQTEGHQELSPFKNVG